MLADVVFIEVRTAGVWSKTGWDVSLGETQILAKMWRTAEAARKVWILPDGTRREGQTYDQQPYLIAEGRRLSGAT